MIDTEPEELWMEVHDIVWEAGIKTISKWKKKKNLQKGQMVVWEGLKNSWKRKKEEKKKAKERKKDIPIWMQNSKE